MGLSDRTITQFVIRDLEDNEIGRANDASSAWDHIEVKWPDARACVLGGTWTKGWTKLHQHLQEGEALILRLGRPVRGVRTEGE